jgi:hypothetical protein
MDRLNAMRVESRRLEVLFSGKAVKIGGGQLTYLRPAGILIMGEKSRFFSYPSTPL